jgi:alkanesulfonate monooxygenase SsuD/methylene tetrahydromethanopterin reductase-like flavin-dependent oxidoreductase (luciferase family)
MRLGLTLAGVPLPDKMLLAQRAQEAGFAIVFTDDNPGGDAIVALASMAVAAPRISVGSGILRAFTRHPVTIASAFANLNVLSEAGVVLGLGSGTRRQNLLQYGIEVPRPVERLRSVIDMVRGCWTSWAQGEPFRWADAYHTVEGLRSPDGFLLRQDSAWPAIWIAAVNPRMLRLAGEIGDGLAGHPVFSVDYLRDIVQPAITAGRAVSGSATPFTLAAWVITAVDFDRARARHRAARQIAFYLSTRSYRDVLAFYGCGDLAAPLRQAVLVEGDLDRAARLFPTDVIDRIAVTGTLEQIREQLQRYRALADLVVLMAAGGDASTRSRDLEALLALSTVPLENT